MLALALRECKPACRLDRTRSAHGRLRNRTTYSATAARWFELLLNSPPMNAAYSADASAGRSGGARRGAGGRTERAASPPGADAARGARALPLHDEIDPLEAARRRVEQPANDRGGVAERRIRDDAIRRDREWYVANVGAQHGDVRGVGE